LTFRGFGSQIAFVAAGTGKVDRRCKIKQRLAEAYSRELQKYSNAALAITRQTGTPDAEALNREADEARLNVEMARLEFDFHVAEHGCGKGSPPKKESASGFA
jgi:hypothetical protein